MQSTFIRTRAQKCIKLMLKPKKERKCSFKLNLSFTACMYVYCVYICIRKITFFLIRSNKLRSIHANFITHLKRTLNAQIRALRNSILFCNIISFSLRVLKNKLIIICLFFLYVHIIMLRRWIVEAHKMYNV